KQGPGYGDSCGDDEGHMHPVSRAVTTRVAPARAASCKALTWHLAEQHLDAQKRGARPRSRSADRLRRTGPARRMTGPAPAPASRHNNGIMVPLAPRFRDAGHPPGNRARIARSGPRSLAALAYANIAHAHDNGADGCAGVIVGDACQLPPPAHPRRPRLPRPQTHLLAWSGSVSVSQTWSSPRR